MILMIETRASRLAEGFRKCHFLKKLNNNIYITFFMLFA